MTTLLTIVAAIAIGLCSPREDTPAARTLTRIWGDLRAATWKRLAWITLCILGGGVAVLAIVLFSTARAGLYGAGVAVAALACWAASLAAVDRRPVRIHLEIRA